MGGGHKELSGIASPSPCLVLRTTEKPLAFILSSNLILVCLSTLISLGTVGPQQGIPHASQPLHKAQA